MDDKVQLKKMLMEVSDVLKQVESIGIDFSALASLAKMTKLEKGELPSDLLVEALQKVNSKDLFLSNGIKAAKTAAKNNLQQIDMVLSALK